MTDSDLFNLADEMLQNDFLIRFHKARVAMADALAADGAYDDRDLARDLCIPRAVAAVLMSFIAASVADLRLCSIAAAAHANQSEARH